MKRMAVISAGFVPVPAVDGGAGEVLTTEQKEKCKIGANDFVYMYTGRVRPEKGVLELIKSFKKVLAKVSNAKLMVVGSRWYNQMEWWNITKM